MALTHADIDAMGEEQFDALAASLADPLLSRAAVLSGAHAPLMGCALMKAFINATLLIAPNPEEAKAGLQATINNIRELMDDPAELAQAWHAAGTRFGVPRAGEERKQ